jgi:hypothetical protein
VGAGERVIKSLRLLVVAGIVGLVISLPISALAQSSPTAKTESTSSVKPLLLVAVAQIEPFVVVGADGSHSGFSIDLIEDISDEVGFDIQYVDVDSVEAELDAVREGRVDLAISAISITSAREKTVNFSTSMFESGIQVMISSGSGSISGSKIFSDIFSPFLFVVLGLMLFGSVLTGVFVWAWERRHGNDQFTNSGAQGVFDGIWWATVTLFTIGYGDKVPHKVVSRLVTMVWMLVGVLLVATITAQVTSKLTVDRLESKITSAAHLAGKNVISYPGTTSWDYLANHGIKARPVDNVDTAYEEVRSGKADAFVFDASIIQWLVANRSGVKVAGPIIQYENYGIVMAQGSPLTEPINQALLHLREDGTYERLKKSYFG